MFFMNWLSEISRIVVLNLNKRDDRLLEFAKQADDYSIPFERISAIEKENGAEGLRDTMKEVFTEALENNRHNLLVFEDDCEFVEEPSTFNLYMDKVIEQLPENYWMVFLGCQLTGTGCFMQSPNLIRGKKMFATHAVLYSKQGMTEIMGRDFQYPIDNFYVAELQNYGHCYCTYPLLASQRVGYSDIGKNVISWKPFIDQRYTQQMAHIIR
jgi:hypothetical protein